jgi:hypothetical protein
LRFFGFCDCRADTFIRPYYEALAAQGESIRDLLYLSGMTGPKPREAARHLVRRMNQLRLSNAHRIAPCLEGYLSNVVTMADGRVIEDGAIYGGGIVTYSIGFWLRREREGTSAALLMPNVVTKLLTEDELNGSDE